MNTRTRHSRWNLFPTALLLAFVTCLGLIRATGLRASEVPVLTTTALQSAATTGNGTVIGPAFWPRCREVAIYVNWSTGSNAGVVKVESAHDPTFTGTWATLATDTWAAANSVDIIQITGVHAAIRTRISTTVTGGTVSTWAVCN